MTFTGLFHRAELSYTLPLFVVSPLRFPLHKRVSETRRTLAGLTLAWILAKWRHHHRHSLVPRPSSCLPSLPPTPPHFGSSSPGMFCPPRSADHTARLLVSDDPATRELPAVKRQSYSATSSSSLEPSFLRPPPFHAKRATYRIGYMTVPDFFISTASSQVSGLLLYLILN